MSIECLRSLNRSLKQVLIKERASILQLRGKVRVSWTLPEPHPSFQPISFELVRS
jgi:hypothetical protein